ncbi:MAG: hypothetical protein FJY29_02680 [Betaproteobacteria bacterium]|nr:hypothetical protein [Betaproteobacteria bacterium]
MKPFKLTPCSPKILPLLLAFLALFAVTPTAFAIGGYTSPGSRAFADANQAGDYLLAGDNKLLLRRAGFEAALKLSKEFPAEPSVVTGGLLERRNTSSENTRAIVCTETKIHILDIDSEGKSTQKIESLAKRLRLSKPRELRCAVNPNSGQWLAVSLNSGWVAFGSELAFQLPEISGRWTHVLAISDSFFVLGENGAAAQVTLPQTDTGEAEVRRVKSPFADLENRDTLFARGGNVLRTGEQQTAISSLLPGSDFPQWTTPQKISISPCSEAGGCGAWLGDDQRWIVAGSWGTFVGRGLNYSRISAPLLASEATSLGVALVPDKSQFILVGDIDADVRSLPEEASLARFVFAERLAARKESQGRHKTRHLVWLRGNAANIAASSTSSAQYKPLFSYRTHAQNFGHLGEVIIHEGRLPEVWPKHWVAVEPEVEFEPLSLASEWSPAAPSESLPVPKSSWWVQASGLPAALKEIENKNLRLRKVVVAIVDSGVDTKHPLLQSVLEQNAQEIPENGIDDDSNGLIDDVFGYDFVDEDGQPSDDFGHGTHVAGLVSNTWSTKGILGGAPNARLRIFKALDSSGKSNSIDLARAISAAVGGRVDILNCSWGGGPETQALRDAFAAAKASGILIFSSAGNDGLNTNSAPPVPKRFPGVLSIGASTANNSRARFSNWGEKAVFAFAPGADITSTLPGAQLGEKSGTSMASPVAASLGALLLGALRELHPKWSREQQNAETERLLCAAALPNKPSTSASKCGIIQAHRALNLLLERAP